MSVNFCPSCGGSFEGNRRYCPCCGDSLKQEADNVPQSFSQQQPTPSFYVNTNNTQNNNTNPFPVVQPTAQNSSSGACSIIGLVLGIVSIVMCCTSFFAITVGIAGIVLSWIGLKSGAKRGCAIAGLMCSITGTLMAFVETIVILM